MMAWRTKTPIIAATGTAIIAAIAATAAIFPNFANAFIISFLRVFDCPHAGSGSPSCTYITTVAVILLGKQKNFH